MKKSTELRNKKIQDYFEKLNAKGMTHEEIILKIAKKFQLSFNYSQFLTYQIIAKKQPVLASNSSDLNQDE